MAADAATVLLLVAEAAPLPSSALEAALRRILDALPESAVDYPKFPQIVRHSCHSQIWPVAFKTVSARRQC